MLNFINRWFRGGEKAALRAEVDLLRKALSRTDAVMGGGQSAFLNDSPMLGAAREQEKHFSGWIYSAIRPIAQRIASQPIRVGRKTGRPRGAKDVRDGLEALPNHPIIRAIEHPNEVMTGWSLLYNTVASLELTGRAFWWMIGDPEDHQIFPLPSSWVEPHHEKGLFSSYMIRPRFAGAAMQVELDGLEVIRFYYPDPQNPVRGSISPLQAAALAVNTDEAIQLAQQQAFQNGIFPGMAVVVGRDPDMHPDDGKADERPFLRKEQRSNLINSILQMYRGSWRYGYPLILDGYIRDVKKISNAPAEMDFQNSSQLTKSRIYQAFGVNPIICGEIENANRAQAAVADEIFCASTINPKIELLSQWMTKWLPARFNDPDVQVWMELARPSDPEQTRAELDQLAKYGGITVNELRAAYNFPPVPDGDKLIEAGRGQLDNTSKDFIGGLIQDKINYAAAHTLWRRAFGDAA